MKSVRKKNDIVIRIAGDSGDGIQLIGTQFTYVTSLSKNKALNFPEFPAEIRAPRGSVSGVSSFQLHFGDENVLTIGDECDVLIVMNAASLKAALKYLKKGGILIANTNGFERKNLSLAGYEENPLPALSKEYDLYELPVETLTLEALKDSTLSRTDKERCKNMFLLGFISWLFNKNPQHTIDFIESKFSRSSDLKNANLKAFQAGYHYGETTEVLNVHYEVPEAFLEKGTYRGISGNHALVLGLVAASHKSGLPLLYCSYPITPASDILKYLSEYLNRGVKTFQAEDEISSICAAIGASYGGSLAVTGTSGPGLALKVESINLAVMLELPLVIVDVQRAGPSTGMPTKTEQSDLLFAVFGRPGDSPVPVLAAASPSDCFYMAYEACRIALHYMTPVILLSDAFLANGAEAWKFPLIEDLPPIQDKRIRDKKIENFSPYLRDEHFVRPWAVPGNPYTIHRIGGLEKNPQTGSVSYDPTDHQVMTNNRKQKIDCIADEIPPVSVHEGNESGDVLLLGWGSTFSVLKSVSRELNKEGYKVSALHIRYIHPLPTNLGEVLKKFKKIIVPEMNTGQFIKLIRERYLVDAIGYNKVQGIPITHKELKDFVLQHLA
jgi:2-oxoglutarate ferredoxin oxidoreductase subunit alpha